MSQGELLLYGVLPYAAIAVFVVGHWWRYRYDQYGWGARSTQFLESRTLRYGSTVFHVGVLLAIGGHLLGILVPISWTRGVGLTDSAYHVVAVVGGMTAGVAVTAGFAALVFRRIRFPRVRVTTTRIDVAALALLTIGIVTGMLATITNFGDAVHYRQTVGPYFRQILVLDPKPELMTGHGITFIFQLHVAAVWFLYALWPFSRLVHAWSIPVDFLRRSPIPYRVRGSRPPPPRRAGAPAARPGVAGPSAAQAESELAGR